MDKKIGVLEKMHENSIVSTSKIHMVYSTYAFERWWSSHKIILYLKQTSKLKTI